MRIALALTFVFWTFSLLAKPQLSGDALRICVSDDNGVQCFHDPDHPTDVYGSDGRTEEYEGAWDDSFDGTPCDGEHGPKPGEQTCQQFLDGIAPAHLALDRVTKFWTHDYQTCASHSAGVTCWPSQEMKSTTAIAGRRCEGKFPGAKPEAPVAFELAGFDHLTPFVQDRFSPFECAPAKGTNGRGENGEYLICTTGHFSWNQCQGDAFHSFYYTALPLTHLTVAMHGFCAVNARGAVVCADDSLTPYLGENPFPPTEFRMNEVRFGRPLHNVRQLAAGDGTVCALDDQGVVCGDMHDCGCKHYYHESIAHLKMPRRIAVSSHLVCGVDDFELRCWDTFDSKPYNGIPKLTVGRWLFDPSTFSQGLRWMERHSYRAKAEVFHAAVDIDKKLDAAAPAERDAGRLLLMNALLPFSESIAADFFAQQVVPNFRQHLQAANQAAKVQSIVDIPRSPAVTRAALSLLVAGLREWQKDGKWPAWGDRALAQIGVALSVSDTELASSAAAARALFSAGDSDAEHAWLFSLLPALG